MKIDKQFIVQNLITILCALCVVALFFSFVTMTFEIESNFIGSSSDSVSLSGWDALSEYPLGWLLLIGPVLLVAMNYIKKLERFKGLLAIFVPILCIAILFLTLSDAKTKVGLADSAMNSISDIANSALDDFDYDYDYDYDYDDYDYSDYRTEASADSSAGIGFYILLIANIGIIISGAITYFGLRLDDLSTVKESGRAILNSAREAALSAREEDPSAPMARSAPVASGAKKNAPESVIKTSAEDALQLIERLAKMRDSGILTEEEFQEKKQDLLKGV